MEKNNYSKLKISIILIFLIIVVLVIAKYITTKEFRDFVDMKILGKQISETNIDSIEINSEDNPCFFAYDSYIGIIAKNKISIYNNKSNLVASFEIHISNPIISTNGKYAVIAEKDGNKFYVINSTSLLFQEKIEGKINKIFINKNGYISIIASNSTYSSIIYVYDNDNNELFKTFSPSTYTMCTCISDSNNQIAIGEINYSGTIIKSNIRIIKIDSAKTIYEFNAPENEILTNIVNSDNEIVICSFSNSVYKLDSANNTSNKIFDIKDDKNFVNIDLKNTLSIIERESSSLFSYDYKLKLISTISSNENVCFLDNGLPKFTIANSNYIALNYGNQINIINKNGSLKKSYKSSQQIKDLILGDHICGVVYKDKIDIISL